MVFHMIYFRIGFIVTLHLAIVFIIGIIDSQGELKSSIWTLINRDYSVAPSGGDSNPLILEFVHFVNLICVIAFVETTYIDKCVTSEEVPPCLIRLSRAIDWLVELNHWMIICDIWYAGCLNFESHLKFKFICF